MIFDQLEFRELKSNPSYNKYLYWIPVNQLQPTVTQLFTERMYKNTEVFRMLLKLGTGLGKTLVSLLISKYYSSWFKTYYIEFKKEYKCFIIGFSKPVFKRELIKFPELGVITYQEQESLKKLSATIQNAREELRESLIMKKKQFVAKIRKRITDPGSGGFYEFFGYKELSNNLFIDKLPDDINSSNVFSEYKKGNIRVDDILLEKFRHSFIICDEIHMTYNSAESNNYGIALQFILDYFGKDISAIFLSATIINNNKRELIDNVNLIKDPEVPHFISQDYFFTDKDINKISKKSLEPIYEQYRGKTIFLEENTEDYPDLIYMGKNMKMNPDGDYIKFTECPMSPLHEATFADQNLYEEKTSNHLVHDIVIPNPDFSAEDILQWHPDHPKFAQRNMKVRGLFDSAEIISKIKNSSADWRRKIGIELTVEKNYYVLSGSWLHKSNLPIYSSKAVNAIKILENELKEDPMRKFLIYHQYVKGSGIIMIQEILRANGFIATDDMPSMDTLSSEVYLTRKEWFQKYGDKEFFPAKIFTLQYEVNENVKNEMIDAYNSDVNKYGKYIKGFLGAQKIQQSIDFKGTQFMIIWHRPQNIPKFIQIKGRVVRNGSLSMLPPDKRTVRLYTLLSTSAVKGNYTIEYKKYKKKIANYKEIQQIELNINKYAINNYINKTGRFESVDALGALPFNIKKLSGPIKTDTYFTHGNHKYVFQIINALVKRAFVSNSVWSEEQLWDFIENNPASNIDFGIKGEIQKLYKNIFKYVLFNLLYQKNNIDIKFDLFDESNIFFNRTYINGKIVKTIKKVIVKCGKYYVLVPVDKYGNLDLSVNSFMKKHQNLRYSRFKLDVTDLDKKTFLELDSFLKSYKVPQHILLNFKNEQQYLIMKNHIDGTRELPQDIFAVYKSLGIAGKKWYLDSDKKNIFNGETWDILQLDIVEEREENDIIIGIIDDGVFKLKDAKSDKLVDRRKNMKGMSCLTTKKNVLNDLYKKLNMVMPSSKKVSDLCEGIFLKLIELEIVSRKAEKGLRYMYLFNEKN